MKKIILNISVLFVSVLIVLAGGEIISRIYLSYQDKMLRQKRQDNILTQVPKQELFIPIKPGSFTNRPSAAVNWWGLQVHTDSLGCRQGAAAPEGSRTLLFLGDSMIFGLGLADSLTIPALLQLKLNELKPDAPCRVINAGVIGYDFQQYFYQLQRLAPSVKPALILVGICYNDLLPNEDPFGDVLAEREASPPATSVVKASAGAAPSSSLKSQMFSSLRKTALYELWQRSGLAAKVSLSKSPPKDPAQRRSTQRAPELVQELIRYAAELNAPIAFVYFPVYASLGAAGEIVYLSLLIERQQPLLDLSFSPRLNKESYFLRENSRGRMDADIHFNLQGSREVAAEIGGWLVQEGLWK